VSVLGRELARSQHPHYSLGFIPEFSRTGNKRDRTQHLLETAYRAHHLEGQLRNAVAEIGKRQPLEHHIGETTIGRRIAFFGDDQGIGKLRLVTFVGSDGQAGEIKQFAIGPDPQHGSNRTFTQPYSEICKVRIRRHRCGDGRSSTHTLAATGRLRTGAYNLFKVGRTCPGNRARP
jgi:hypothetical protein